MASHSERPLPRFARNLRIAQDEAGLNNRELAEALGIGESLLGKYRRGDVTPATERAVEISRVVGRPVEWFFEDHDELGVAA